MICGVITLYAKKMLKECLAFSQWNLPHSIAFFGNGLVKSVLQYALKTHTKFYIANLYCGNVISFVNFGDVFTHGGCHCIGRKLHKPSLTRHTSPICILVRVFTEQGRLAQFLPQWKQEIHSRAKTPANTLSERSYANKVTRDFAWLSLSADFLS